MSIRTYAEFVLVAFVVVLAWFAQVGWDRVVKVSFERDSVEAVNSQTEQLNGMYMRRVVQTERDNDSISKLLKTKNKIKANIGIKIPEVTVDGTTVTQRPDSAPLFPMVFLWENIHRKPYTLGAQVNVFNADSAQAILSVMTDPIPLTVRVECGELRDGVRPATFLVAPGDSLDFLEISVDSVIQSKEVCTPETRVSNIARMSRIKTAAKWGTIGALLGAFIQSIR